ncbi:MAG: hypothetical protein RSC62_08030, partial [Cetobacterium sp.]|uniref:hypothetical protein n=1 Tax=Cetobacterium sp. TaxID=2071632 RepID=UPI002FCB12FF
TSFSKDINTSNPDMNITAQVIKPLVVTNSGDINFGKVIQGTTSTAADNHFLISGEPGQNIKLDINGSNMNAFSKTVTLTHDKLKTKTLNVKLTNVSHGGNNTKLDKDGKFKYKFDASVSPTTLTEPGLYSGILSVKVTFN